MQEDTTITASLKKSQLLVLPLLVLLVVLGLRQQRLTSIFEAVAASFFGLGRMLSKLTENTKTQFLD